MGMFDKVKSFLGIGAREKELQEQLARSEERVAVLSGKRVIEDSVAEMLSDNGSDSRSSGGLETPIADILRDKGITGLDETKLDGAKLKDFPTLICEVNKIGGVGTDGKSASDVLIAEYAKEAHLTKREVAGLKLCATANRDVDIFTEDIIFAADNILREHCEYYGERLRGTFVAEVNLIKASLDSDKTATPLYGLCIETIKERDKFIPQDKLGQVVLVGLSERYGNSFTDKCLLAGDDGIKIFCDFLKLNSHEYDKTDVLQYKGPGYYREELCRLYGMSCDNEKDFGKFVRFADAIYKSMIDYDKKFVFGKATGHESLLDVGWAWYPSRIDSLDYMRKGVREHNEFLASCREKGREFAYRGRDMSVEDVSKIYDSKFMGVRGVNSNLCLCKKEAMEAIVQGYKEEKQKIADKHKSRNTNSKSQDKGSRGGERG